MVAEHRALLAEAKSMATKLSATADTAADAVRDLMNHARDQVKDLTEKAAGADWDKDFINKMIDDHQKVLDKLQDAAKNTTNTDLRAALEKATGKVQQHLTKAQDIKSKRPQGLRTFEAQWNAVIDGVPTAFATVHRANIPRSSAARTTARRRR